jgi:hypothetical protein
LQFIAILRAVTVKAVSIEPRSESANSGVDTDPQFGDPFLDVSRTDTVVTQVDLFPARHFPFRHLPGLDCNYPNLSPGDVAVPGDDRYFWVRSEDFSFAGMV